MGLTISVCLCVCVCRVLGAFYESRLFMSSRFMRHDFMSSRFMRNDPTVFPHFRVLFLEVCGRLVDASMDESDVKETSRAIGANNSQGSAATKRRLKFRDCAAVRLLSA